MVAGLKQFNRAFFRDLWKLAAPYWRRSEERWSARALLFAVIALNLLMVFISYRITEWYNTFWNALQQYNAGDAWHQILVFTVLVVPYIVAAVYQTFLMQMLQIRWRRWLTRGYLNAWLDHSMYYHLQILGDGTDNPDQRISEDLSSFTSQTLNLAVGLLSSITTLAAFLSMLWGLSREAAIPFHGGRLVIPGYLVWVAALYAVVGTILVASVGRPLIKLQFNQERFNADFRFSLVRLRENSESVALYRGEDQERRGFLARFTNIYQNFRQIMRRTRRLNWWVSGYGQAAVIFPVLVSMPAYFAKAIQIGTIMQISSAFGQVQSALSYIVNSYTDLAAWHAVVDRLRFFQQAIERAERIRAAARGIVRQEGRSLRATGLDVSLPDGRLLVRQLSFEVRSGERLLITGASGSGKSTLVRTLAGIWPFGAGIVELPRGEVALALPQKPYLPLGSLRDVLVYPYGQPASATDAAILDALRLAGLQALMGRLGESQPWSQILSLGEQQRLAFARLFLQRPSWILMDEATSALDEPAEATLYKTLLHELPQAGIISVGHRSSLAAFHKLRLAIGAEGSWSFQEIG